MANNETKFCDACHGREATCHTTTIVEGKQEVADLCSFCFEALGSPYAREMAAQMRNAKCDFCGAPANMGGTDSMALSVGVQRFQHLCFACSDDYHEFVQTRVASLSSSMPQEEQLAKIRTLLVDAEAHMRQKVKGKKMRPLKPPASGNGATVSLFAFGGFCRSAFEQFVRQDYESALRQ